MSNHKRRFNYQSHLVDASADAVIRLAKTAAFIASVVILIVGINTLAFFRIQASFGTVALFMASAWVAVWSILFMVQSSWVAYMVHTDFDELIRQMESKEDVDPPPPTGITRVYKPHSTGYTLEHNPSGRVGGVDEIKPKG
jgi:fatty acid desaturase